MRLLLVVLLHFPKAPKPGLLIPINFNRPGWWIETFPAVLLFKRSWIYPSISLKNYMKKPSSTKYRRRIKEEDQGKEKPGYLIS